MRYANKAFGIVISTLRVHKGLTQERLSGLAGIARSHLAALDSGEMTFMLDKLWRISDALQVAPSDLVMLTEVENRRSRNKPVADRKKREK